MSYQEKITTVIFYREKVTSKDNKPSFTACCAIRYKTNHNKDEIRKYNTFPNLESNNWKKCTLVTDHTYVKIESVMFNGNEEMTYEKVHDLRGGQCQATQNSTEILDLSCCNLVFRETKCHLLGGSMEEVLKWSSSDWHDTL